MSTNKNIYSKVYVKNWSRVGMQFIFLGIFSYLFSSLTVIEDWKVHGYFCSIGLILVFTHFYKYRSYDFTYLLFDLRFMFLFAFALFDLYGALFLVYGPSDSVEYSMSRYPISVSLALKVDAINNIGFGISILVYNAIRPKYLIRLIQPVCQNLSKRNILKVIFWLAIIGISGRLNVLISDFSQATNDLNSGLWRSLSQVLIGATLLSGMYQGKYQKVVVYTGLIISILNSLSGLISFSKIDTIIPLMAFGMGVAIRKRSALYAIGITLFGALLLSVLGDLVLYARINSTEGMPLFSRLQVLETSISKGLASDLDDYSSWYRLSYTVPQGAAIEFYQQGNGGDDLLLIPYTFVPRTLFPSKPNMSLAGTDFYTKFSGLTGSSEAMGVFINGYYNWGWIGIFFVSFVCGWILAQVSALLQVIVFTKTYLLYPIVFVGVYMAFSVGGTLIVDYLGMFNILMAIIIFLYFTSGGRSQSKLRESG